MAKDDKKNLKGKDAEKADDSADQEEKPKLEPISPVKRKRLQKMFEHGSAQAAKGQFDYAADMFAGCVAGDPGNLIYTENFLANLIKKYNNKKGAKMVGLGAMKAKGSMKKSQMKKDWPAAIKAGLEYLKSKPWDASTLTEMAAACEQLELEACRLAYFKMALDGNQGDVNLNRKAADAFAENSRFDEAINCLEQILKKKPGDEETERLLNEFTVDKTIHRGGYEEAETSIDVSVEKRKTERRGEAESIELTPEQKFRREIRRHPEEVANYKDLADYYIKKEDLDAARAAMREGVDATGSVKAREYLEDIDLMEVKRNVAIADRKARAEIEKNKARDAQDRSEKYQRLTKKLRIELNQREIEILGDRCGRYPGDHLLKYEYGLRLKRAAKFKEAIEQFQLARHEPRKTAAAYLELGKCFGYIKQHKLAQGNYQSAIDEAGQWDDDVKKEALYRAGRISNEKLDDLAAAEGYFSELAGMDYAYRDVARQLDDVSSRRKQENDGQAD